MLTGSQIVTAEKIFKTIYNQAVAQMVATNPWAALAQLATEITSDGAEEDYRWLAEMPAFAEWLGDITVDDLADYFYTIRNKHFAAAVGVDADEIADDKFNLIRPRIASLAVRAMQHRGKLVQDMILNGTTYKAFDGIAFFSDVSGVRLNDNLLAGTISAATPTIAQVEADIDTVRQAMMQFVDGRGETLGIPPTVFAVHPKLERIFRTVARSGADPGTSNSGTYNPFQSWMTDVIVLPGATDINDFYAFAVDFAVKPIIFQSRQPQQPWLNANNEKVNRKLVFGSDYRGNVGYSLPVLAAKVVSGVA